MTKFALSDGADVAQIARYQKQLTVVEHGSFYSHHCDCYATVTIVTQ